jgi:hemolysin activation/secretion protein
VFGLKAVPFALLALTVHAQMPPNAGSLQREAEQAFPRTVPTAILPAPPAPMKQADKGATVTVRAFAIEGATLVSAAELAGLLSDQMGQSLTLAELERVTRRITAHYRARGWFARAYLPAQEIVDGVIRIVVVEGRFSGLQLDPAAPTRADTNFASQIAGHGLVAGQPLPAARLERNLLLANDQPGIATTGILEPGEVVGETTLRIKVEDTPLFSGDAAYANHGSRSTGTDQLTTSLALAPGDGSQVRLNVLAAERITSVRAQYGLPLGSDGWRASVHVSDLRYTLGGDFAKLNASGSAQTTGLTASYPILRTAAANLNTSAMLENRHYADDSLGAASKRKQADVLVLSAFGDRSDDLLGGGINQGNLSLMSGKLDLSGLASDLSTDQTTARSNGQYTKLAGQFSRLQKLPGSFSMNVALAAQMADKNLDSSEKFALGGPNGVRAYPVNEAVGDEGWLLNVELRNELGNNWRVFGFYDSGEVLQHRNTWAGWQGGSSTPNRYALSGTGLGLAWAKPGDLSVVLTLAEPVGDHPGKTTADKNQDGSARETRAWLRVSKFF